MLSQLCYFALALNFIVAIPFSIATAVPYSTAFANSTKIAFPSAAGTTGCPSDCTRNVGPLGSITWTAKTITATITAETVVHVVNKKNNSTRTETITNTEVDLKNYTPLPSTKTTSVVLQFGTTSKTEILTFPSILYEDYPSSYTFCGTLPTTTAGVATCLNYPCAQASGFMDPFNSDSPVFAYPSHPPIPDSIQNISASYLALDPKGSTWNAVWSYDSGYAPLIQPLMPDMGAWNCTPYGEWAAPASVLNAALYLTATSTSTEAGDEASATPVPEKSPSKEAPEPVASKKPATTEPSAAEASQMIANPFGLKKPAAVVETPTRAPSSPVAVAPAPSPDQAANDDKPDSNTPASNPAPKKASSNADTSSNQAANQNTGSSNVPAGNPASPQEGSSSVAPAPNQGANANKAAPSPPAADVPSPQEASSNVASSSIPAANAVSAPAAANSPSSQGSDSNNAALLPVPGLDNQAGTAVPVATANAVANIVISSTNAQGGVVVTTSQAPGVIVTSTNAQGSQVVTTMPIVSPQVLDNAPTPTPVVVNGHTLTTNSQSQYVIAAQTLSANTPLILGSGASTTPVLLQTSGIHPVLVIGSSTTTLHLPSSTPTLTATTTSPPAITIGTQTITANAQGQYLVGSQTLTPGGEIVVGATTAPGGTVAVGGTTVSLAPSATQAVVGTSTEGLAPYIAGGLGSGPNGTGVVQFIGGAGRGVQCRLGYLVGIVGILWAL